MTTDYSQAVADAEDTAPGGLASFVERLGERVGVRAQARAAFGDPVERDGVTVIPVARVRWGFGGGAGSGGKEGDVETERGQGAGGGGGGTASPLGYIEISGGRAEFHRIKDPAALWPVIVAGAFSSWLVLRGLRALFR